MTLWFVLFAFAFAGLDRRMVLVELYDCLILLELNASINIHRLTWSALFVICLSIYFRV